MNSAFVDGRQLPRRARRARARRAETLRAELARAAKAITMKETVEPVARTQLVVLTTDDDVCNLGGECS